MGGYRGEKGKKIRAQIRSERKEKCFNHEKKRAKKTTSRKENARLPIVKGSSYGPGRRQGTEVNLSKLLAGIISMPESQEEKIRVGAMNEILWQTTSVEPYREKRTG